MTIRVTASNVCGASAQVTKTVPFDCSGGNNPVKVSPNPAKDVVNIEFQEEQISDKKTSKEEDLTVTLMNQYNLTVYKKTHKSTQFSINVSGFQTGIYYLQITKGNKKYSEKIIISK